MTIQRQTNLLMEDPQQQLQILSVLKCFLFNLDFYQEVDLNVNIQDFYLLKFKEAKIVID